MSKTKKSPLKKVLITVICTILLIVTLYLIFIAVTSYFTKYHTTRICKFDSPNNEYSLIVHQVGTPTFTEPHNITVTLKNGLSVVEKKELVLLTDGEGLFDEDFSTEWYSDRVEIFFPAEILGGSDSLVIYLN